MRQDGASSFDRCRRTLDELLECGIAVSIRCTITARSAGSLPYFAALLNRAYPNVTSLSVDSIALSGRAREGKLERVSPDAFSAAIRNARFAAAGRIAIVTQLARLNRFGYYCAPADLLSTIFVSPDERIFSCQERPEAQSRHSKDNPFVIGRFNAEGKPVVGRFESMSRMHIALGNENCRNCVALYYCAGGCKSRISFDEDGCISDEESQYWCSLTQAVSAEEMWSYASDELLYPQAKREFIQIKPDISVAIATLGM